MKNKEKEKKRGRKGSENVVDAEYKLTVRQKIQRGVKLRKLKMV